MPTFTSSTLGTYTSKWLIRIGILELVLAAVFLIVGWGSSELRFGFSLTAGILGAVGVGLVAFGMRTRARAEVTQRILDTGIPGQATITSLTQTGLFLNENPQVEMNLMITVTGKPPYAATRKEFVPLIMLGRLSSGMPLAVKVDPADPSNVIIDWSAPPAAPATTGMAAPTASPVETLSQVQQAVSSSGIQAAGVFAEPGQGGHSVEQLRDFLRATGIAGTATIDTLQDTGKIVGDERVYIMETTINIPGRPSHRSPASAAMVPLTAMHKVALGVTVPIKVAADNPDMVMFEWDKL
jgi:hypothetical protein